MMDNRTKKIIYKLRINKNSEREIKKILNEKYDRKITLSEIKKISDKMPYDKSKYTVLEKNKILYMYKNAINTYKLIEYLNNKYGYDLTYSKIKDLACRYLVKKNYQNMYEQSFVTRKDGLEFFISSASKKFITWCKFALEEIGMENIKINFIKNDFKGIYIIRSAKLSNIEILKTKVYDKRYGMNGKYDLLLGKTLRDYNRRY